MSVGLLVARLNYGLYVGHLSKLAVHFMFKVVRLVVVVSSVRVACILGVSGSMVLILLFVIYSSIILYYGACFVKILSDARGKPIRTVKEAFSVELLEIKDNKL